jgi:hypothetical protein
MDDTNELDELEGQEELEEEEVQEEQPEEQPAEQVQADDDAAKKAVDDEKRRAHEEAEAKRKAEFDAKQKAKKEAAAQAVAALAAMSDAEVIGASVKRTGADLELITRRNMKTSVTQYVQALCKCDPALARLTMHPRKSMLHCFRYIGRKAQEYLKQEMEALDEKPDGNGIGGDVPDDLCYQWAVDYFRDPKAEEDNEKEEKFVPKPYYGGGKSSKPKKEPKPKPEPKKKPAPPKPEEEQISLFGEAVTASAA